MGRAIALYRYSEQKILKSLEANGIKHRPKASSGLWVGLLMGLSATATFLKEDSSYSEICLIVGVSGIGLIISAFCIYFRLSSEKVAIKDFQLIYFLPAIVLSMLYLLVVNKGLLVSAIWGLGVGTLSTWGVLQLMSNFPGSFTIGEATTVMHGATLFLISAVANLPLRYHLPPIHNNDIITVLLQIGILYVLSVCAIAASLPVFHSAKFFYLMAFSTLLTIVLPILYILLDQNPITWALLFIFNKTSRVMLVMYWGVCVVLGIFAVIYQILSNSQATTVTRKIFHVLVTLVYISGLMYDPMLLYLASGVSLGVFMILELMRFLNIPPLGGTLRQGFNVLVDEKDHFVSVTPFYLLCGLSFPLWMPSNNLTLPILFSGVSTIGIGDTAASFVGSKWGKHKWSGSQKTIEGTVACILSQLQILVAIAYAGYMPSSWLLVKSVFAIILSSFVEARTDQIDNLVLPLLMYVCLLA